MSSTAAPMSSGCYPSRPRLDALGQHGLGASRFCGSQVPHGPTGQALVSGGSGQDAAFLGAWPSLSASLSLLSLRELWDHPGLPGIPGNHPNHRSPDQQPKSIGYFNSPLPWNLTQHQFQGPELAGCLGEELSTKGQVDTKKCH